MLNIHWFTYLYNIVFNLSISSNAFDQPEEPRIGQMWKKTALKEAISGWMVRWLCTVERGVASPALPSLIHSV